MSDGSQANTPNVPAGLLRLLDAKAQEENILTEVMEARRAKRPPRNIRESLIQVAADAITAVEDNHDSSR